MYISTRLLMPVRQVVVGWAFLFTAMIIIGTPQETAAQEVREEPGSVGVMFYNVENLFDTIDDPETEDEEYLPDGPLLWNEKRYQAKLRKIAWVIANISEWNYPGIVGLVEVENELVIEDLIHQSALRSVPYHYAVTKGADPRGIDVALLWDSRLFRLVYANEIPHYGKPLNYALHKDPRNANGRNGSGRNSLWVTLQDKKSGRMMDVFVIHAPSRKGGTRSTSKKRMEVIKKITQLTTGIHERHPESRILVMGDFNDNPSSPPIRKMLRAHAIPSDDNAMKASKLYNLSDPIERIGEGTHLFEGRLWTPDQIIVSGNLLRQIPKKRVRIFKHSELWDAKMKQIHRTYNGTFYKGGYSDHLPIIVDIER